MGTDAPLDRGGHYWYDIGVMSSAPLLPDECRILADARRGDRGAFDALAAAYAPKLFGFCLRITGSPQEAEDLSQDTFLLVFRSIRGYRSRCTFSTWLYTVAINRWRTIVRDRHTPPESLETAAGEDDAGSPVRQWADPGPSVERLAEASENVERVRRALARLPAEQRTAVVLQHLYGYRLREIASITRAKIGTVSARVVRGMRTLERLLADRSPAP